MIWSLVAFISLEGEEKDIHPGRGLPPKWCILFGLAWNLLPALIVPELSSMAVTSGCGHLPGGAQLVFHQGFFCALTPSWYGLPFTLTLTSQINGTSLGFSPLQWLLLHKCSIFLHVLNILHSQIFFWHCKR